MNLRSAAADTPPIDLVQAILHTGGFYATIDSATAQANFVKLVTAHGATNIDDATGSNDGGLLLPGVSVAASTRAGEAIDEFYARPGSAKSMTFELRALMDQEISVELRDLDSGAVIASKTSDSTGRISIIADPRSAPSPHLAVRSSANVLTPYTVIFNVQGVPDSTTCTITGTAGNDRLVGTTGNDVICGHAGNDVLIGRGGRDVIEGGAGNDRLYGESGNDRLIGGPGRDRLYAHSGKDYLSGGSGADRLYGGSGKDRLYGGSGADRLRAGSGKDRASGGSGPDRIWGGSGSDHLFGRSGADRIYGGSGNDYLSGGRGRDALLGGPGKDRLVGGPGRDKLRQNG